MDLHPMKDIASDHEKVVIDRFVAQLTQQVAREHLLPLLREVQAEFGWISPGAMNHMSAVTAVPPADIYGVATFYTLLATKPSAKRVLHMCDDVACRQRGSRKLVACLEAKFADEGASIDDACWKRSTCLGLCERAPAAFVQQAGEGRFESEFAVENLEHALDVLRNNGDERATLPPVGSVVKTAEAERVVSVNAGAVDPSDLDSYVRAGGLTGLNRAKERGASWVIAELQKAKLLGRGGAGFSAGLKWNAVYSQKDSERYVVCNADESEPGTFKDRALMEEDPFALIEAVTMAAFVVSARRAFIYVRGEFALAASRLNHAIECARNAHWFDGLNVQLEVRRGGGAYICGEETALLNSLEGRRGEPRAKPPYPVQHGLFGKPTLINNVETLVAALRLIERGADDWLTRGTPDSAGTRLFSICGAVARPGVYELALGTPLQTLLELAGADLAHTHSVLLGGAAGSFVLPSEFGVALSFEGTRKARATLGSGAVVVIGDKLNISEVLQGITWFFRHESCGQCVPCREGTVRVDELLTRVRAKTPKDSWTAERARLTDLGTVMRDASICGLGQTAASAVESAFERFGLWPDQPLTLSESDNSTHQTKGPIS